MLARCYRNSLALAQDRNIETIAFPAISTGVYGFPMGKAAHIAIGEALAFLAEHRVPKKVILVCFGATAYKVYQGALKEVRAS